MPASSLSPDMRETAAPRLTSAERTRRALIGAAMHLFGKKGFEGTSTREIALAAKANIGSIAYHFGSKEGLRDACSAHIVTTIGGLSDRVLGGADVPEPRDMSPEQAQAMLRPVIETMVGFLVSRPEAGKIVQFIMREMSEPSAALDAMYNGVLEPMHIRLCTLWEAATGEPAESDATKMTIFSLVGQVIYFRIAREAIKRRMGWTDIGPAQAEAVLSLAHDNLMAVVTARRSKRADTA